MMKTILPDRKLQKPLELVRAILWRQAEVAGLDRPSFGN